jgi:hypothetical protein
MTDQIEPMPDAWSVYGINMLRQRVESSSRLLFTTPARIARHLNPRGDARDLAEILQAKCVGGCRRCLASLWQRA